ncbi:MAG: sialidase family protein [bacterium]|nr:sialidase family protein [bacterium]
MTKQDVKGIVVEKTLHMKNAFVSSMGYTSLSKPILQETIKIDGKDLIRISEDNGKTWKMEGEWSGEKKIGNRMIIRGETNYYLDSDHGLLVDFYSVWEQKIDQDYSFGPDATGELLQLQTHRIFYRFSKDDGKTWGKERQLIQKGDRYDKIHWADGIWYGKNSGRFDSGLRVISLQDGTLIMPVLFHPVDNNGQLIRRADRFGFTVWPYEAVACFRGRWKQDGSDIDWEMSNHISVPEYMSRSLDEPAVAEMSDGTLMMVMRGECGPLQAMTAAKFFSISRDKGKTWGPAVPLTYPDSSLIHSPGSLPNLFRSSKNGKVYLIANILPSPTRHCDPRYPLQIAEIDQTYFWVKPETVTIIENRKKRHPKFVRFSNWQRIEDRETGNPAIYMTEARIDAIIPDPIKGTIIPDSYRYEIKLLD